MAIMSAYNLAMGGATMYTDARRLRRNVRDKRRLRAEYRLTQGKRDMTDSECEKELAEFVVV